MKIVVNKGIKKYRLFIITFFVLLIIICFFAVYYNIKVFDTYKIVKHIDIGGDQFSKYEQFDNNLIKYSRDGVSLFDNKGKSIWNSKYEIQNPKLVKKGNYFCIYSKLGNDIYIYDKNGRIGEINTKTTISKVALSESGNVAAVTEDKYSSYISIYDSTGAERNINIKSIIDGNGYPLEIDLDRTGNKLVVAYEKINGEAFDASVVFYDFAQNGQSIPNKLIGGFDEQFKDSFIADIKYYDDKNVLVISDKSFVFFKFENDLTPVISKEIKYSDKIKSVSVNNEGFIVIYNNDDIREPYKMEIYDKYGTKKYNRSFDFSYKNFKADDKYIYLYNDEEMLIMKMNGKKRFSGKIRDQITYIDRASNNTFNVISKNELLKIKLK